MNRLSLVYAAILLFSSCSSPQSRHPSGNAQSDPTFSWHSHSLGEHPRLFATTDTWGALKAKIARSDILKSYYSSLEDLAEDMLDLQTYPVAPYVNDQLPPNGQWTGADLSSIRGSFTLITTLAGLYRLDGDKRKLNRVVLEYQAISKMRSWPQDDFLAVASLILSEAVAYDWLYYDLPGQDLNEIREAMVSNGLQPGLEAFRARTWWTLTNTNWNQVCVGALGVGALAVADKEPEIAKSLLDSAETALQIPTAMYAPDGGWEESVDYSVDATMYFVEYLASLETALNYRSPLLIAPGVPEYGNFRIYTMGPLYPKRENTIFNFGDDPDPVNDVGAAEMFWFANAVGRPQYSASEIDFLQAHPNQISMFDLLWSPETKAFDLTTLPLSTVFKRVAVAALRSSWDEEATFVGFKGGVANANHGHLDHGSFVLDMDGERWVQDLGRDDYSLPGYFDTDGGQRWTYYRLSTQGHNTLLINGQNQNWGANSPLISYRTQTNHPFAVADLTKAFPASPKRVWRGISLEGANTVLLEDEVDSGPTQIAWNLHTTAQISVTKNRANFTKDGKRVFLEILSPRGAIFQCSMRDAPKGSDCRNITDPQTPLYIPSGISELSIQIHKGSQPLRIAVVISRSESTRVARLKPLTDWIK